jgi:hypothetical protein
MGAFEVWVADKLGGRIVRFDPWLAPLDPFTGNEADGVSFARPVSVSRMPNGDVLVLEQDRLEIVWLNYDGQLRERIARQGDVTGSMERPVRLETARDGRIAVADPGRESVLLFDRFGTFAGERSWPLPGAGPSGLAWSDSLLWACGEGGVTVWQEGPEPLQTWPEGRFEGPVNDLAWQMGRLAVAGGNRVLWFQVRRAR